jgi:hypothetical protein
MTELAANMQASWSARAARALAFVQAAETAPALFKPEAVAEAGAEYYKALGEMARWSV